jgi:hypothetical protein
VGALLAAPLQVHNAAVDPLDPEVASALRSLIDDYRSRCLWFPAPD